MVSEALVATRQCCGLSYLKMYEQYTLFINLKVKLDNLFSISNGLQHGNLVNPVTCCSVLITVEFKDNLPLYT